MIKKQDPKQKRKTQDFINLFKKNRVKNLRNKNLPYYFSTTPFFKW